MQTLWPQEAGFLSPQNRLKTIPITILALQIWKEISKATNLFSLYSIFTGVFFCTQMWIEVTVHFEIIEIRANIIVLKVESAYEDLQSSLKDRTWNQGPSGSL